MRLSFGVAPLQGVSNITTQGSKAMTTISSPDFLEMRSIYADYCCSSSSLKIL